MSDLFFPVSPSATPEVERPAPDRVIAGDPVFTTWLLEDRDGLYCGLWESTPGTWRVSYDEWEYCRILSGISILTEEGGPPSPCAQATVSCCAPAFAASGRWSKPPARIS